RDRSPDPHRDIADMPARPRPENPARLAVPLAFAVMDNTPGEQISQEQDAAKDAPTQNVAGLAAQVASQDRGQNDQTEAEMVVNDPDHGRTPNPIWLLPCPWRVSSLPPAAGSGPCPPPPEGVPWRRACGCNPRRRGIRRRPCAGCLRWP